MLPGGGGVQGSDACEEEEEGDDDCCCRFLLAGWPSPVVERDVGGPMMPRASRGDVDGVGVAGVMSLAGLLRGRGGGTLVSMGGVTAELSAAEPVGLLLEVGDDTSPGPASTDGNVAGLLAAELLVLLALDCCCFCRRTRWQDEEVHREVEAEQACW